MRSNQSIGCNLNKSIFVIEKKTLQQREESKINGNKQSKKEDNKEMQEVGEKKTQKAFLCSTLMKSYAFVIMLCYFLASLSLPSPAWMWIHSEVTRSAFCWEIYGKKDALKSEFFFCINARKTKRREEEKEKKNARNAIN